MIDEKQQELQELLDEVEIILTVKDNISNEEIDNFVNKFHLLSESDIRNKIKEITGDSIYINELADKINVDVNDRSKKEDNDNLNKVVISEISGDYGEVIEEGKKDEINTNSTNEIMLQQELQHENIEEIIFTEDNIPEVTFIKADTKYGQLSLEWGWAKGISKILICYRMDKFPLGPTDSSASQILVRRENNDQNGDYIVHKVIEGNYYFCIYVVVESNEKTIFSEGTRRLVVNKTPSEIFYEIKRKRTFLGKLKGAEIVLSTTDKEISLPQLALVSKYGNMPLQKSDGKSVINTDYQTIGCDKPIVLDLPMENIGKNMYVKLFFIDDSNSKLYRIISPAKEKLYFK